MKLQKVSLEYIAKLAGVHKATVSRALRNHPTIPKATRDRIREIAHSEGYRPNPYVSLYQAQARSNRPLNMQATIAWVNDYPNPESWRQFPWLNGYYRGAAERCEQRGYRLEEIAISSLGPTASPEETQKTSETLNARGIYGVILPLMLNYQYLMEAWENCVVTLIGTGHSGTPGGYAAPSSRFYPMGFPASDRDLYYNSRLAFQNLQMLGYSRVGLVYSRYMDIEAQGTARAGFLIEQSFLPESERLPILFLERFKEGRPLEFDQWLNKYKPSAILCINPAIRTWLSELGMESPRDIGLANLNVVADVEEWSGIRENHHLVGAAAVDLIVGQLSRNEIGVSHSPRKILIPGEWLPGSTLRRPAGK